jgi:hypothetical protein
MTFHIIGDKESGPIKAIRSLPASAAVLAMKWAAEGVERVRIEIDGRSYGPAAFRQQFLHNRERRDRRRP